MGVAGAKGEAGGEGAHSRRIWARAVVWDGAVAGPVAVDSDSAGSAAAAGGSVGRDSEDPNVARPAATIFAPPPVSARASRVAGDSLRSARLARRTPTPSAPPRTSSGLRERATGQSDAAPSAAKPRVAYDPERRRGGSDP